MQVAVLIPFRGDRGLLEWTLEGYRAQLLPAGSSLQVIVGEDGGEGAVSKDASQGGVPVKHLIFPRLGAAAVRNRLVEQVSGGIELIIFGNSDARPDPDMVAHHIAAMSKLPKGSLVLGSAPWEKPAQPTVFDALLAETPMVFFYEGLAAHQWHDFRHAWTLNLSVRVEDFRASKGFHEELRPVYYEDLAFAHRVMGSQKKHVWYEPGARVLHRHPTSLDQYLDREELLGLMAPVLARVCPEAFVALHGTDDLQRLAKEFEQWLKMDRGMHQWIYRRLADWARMPESLLGSEANRRQMLMTIYQMHIPLKRLAFRLGFLRGLELIDDSRWQERKPQSLWRSVVAQ